MVSIFQPKTMKFEFPEGLCGDKNDDENEDLKSLDEAKKSFQTFIDRNKNRSDVPSWFSI